MSNTNSRTVLAVDQALAAFQRAGQHYSRDTLDQVLLETVDKAACSLLRDQWTDGFPIAAYSELLATIAALRSVLGYSPTPTAVDVNTWAANLRNASHDKVMGQPAHMHEVQIVEGPHMGAVIALWGSAEAPAADALPGPLYRLELPTECGDSTDMTFGTAYYKRLKQPHPNTGRWEYMLDREKPFPAEGSRPRFLPVPAQDSPAEPEQPEDQGFVYRAIINWTDENGGAHVGHEGPFNAPDQADRQIRFWEGQLRDYDSEDGTTRASGRVEVSPTAWVPYSTDESDDRA
jgi:hypothetical protein